VRQQLESQVNRPLLPVASSTTRSSVPRLCANNSSSARSVLILPADFARPTLAIATSQKSRCTSNPIDLPTRPLLIDDDTESGGHHDTYGFALPAHPGKSQGRPVTPTGSQPIRTVGLPIHGLPEPLSRNTRQDATRRHGRHPARPRRPFSYRYTTSTDLTRPAWLSARSSESPLVRTG